MWTPAIDVGHRIPGASSGAADFSPSSTSSSSFRRAQTKATRKKILLVDDSVTALMLSRIILRKRPYEVMTAGSGEEAIRKFHDERPDLVILDVVMPGIDGFQACRKLRSIVDAKETPIFLLSAYSDPASIANGMASGCSEFLKKPVNGIELLMMLMRYLGE
jgi:PleD family two-component response regulator